MGVGEAAGDSGRRGLGCTIYGPPFISGHSVSGASKIVELSQQRDAAGLAHDIAPPVSVNLGLLAKAIAGTILLGKGQPPSRRGSSPAACADSLDADWVARYVRWRYERHPCGSIDAPAVAEDATAALS